MGSPIFLRLGLLLVHNIAIIISYVQTVIIYVSVCSRFQHDFKRLVLLCRLKCLQNILRRHDYRAVESKMRSLLIQNILLSQIMTRLILFLYVQYALFRNQRYILPEATIVKEVPYLPQIGGGSGRQCLSSHELEQYIHPAYRDTLACAKGIWSFEDHVPLVNITSNTADNKPIIATFLPFSILQNCVNAKELCKIATKHGIEQSSRKSRSIIEAELSNHECSANCMNYCSIFVVCKKKIAKTTKERQEKWVQQKEQDNPKVEKKAEIIDISPNNADKKSTFPPKPPSKQLLRKIINGFIADTSPTVFLEEGCASCGILRPVRQLTPLADISCKLTPLTVSGITRRERRSVSDPIEDIPGPVLDKSCNKICSYCLKYLRKGKKPPFSLASGFWIGRIPKELECLTYAEKLLISRVRHNRCIIKVASGRYKMRANAIMFKHPTPKIYQTLPPPSKEFDEVLAIIFTGPCKPTQEDIQQTPFLVRQNQIKRALRWLKLNHPDYADISISEKNLNQYPENTAPVCIEYKDSVLNRD